MSLVSRAKELDKIHSTVNLIIIIIITVLEQKFMGMF